MGGVEPLVCEGPGKSHDAEPASCAKGLGVVRRRPECMTGNRCRVLGVYTEVAGGYLPRLALWPVTWAIHVMKSPGSVLAPWPSSQ